MAVKTKKYIVNGENYRGVKLTHRNIFNLAEWCKGVHIVAFPSNDERNFSKADVRIRLKTAKGIRVARPGDVVLKREDGKFLVSKAEEDLVAV